MSAPVVPNDFKNTIADPSHSLCGNFVNVILKLPLLIYKFANWLLDASGNVTTEAKAAFNNVAVGDLIMSASPRTNRDDRLLCDGRAVSRVTYASLYAEIGTTYGIGDGTSTFAIPDFRDRFPIGSSSTKLLAASGGAATVTLTAAKIPSLDVTGWPDQTKGRGLFIRHIQEGGDTDGVAITDFTNGTALVKTRGGVPDTGEAEAHENMPPYLACYVFIKT